MGKLKNYLPKTALIALIIIGGSYFTKVGITNYLSANVLTPLESRTDQEIADATAQANPDITLTTNKYTNSEGKNFTYWFFQNKKAKPDQLVIYVYGIAGLDNPVITKLANNYNVLIFSSPGFYGADDEATESTFGQTTNMTFDLLAENPDFQKYTKIILYSHSMGNYPASIAMQKHSVALHVMAQSPDTANNVCIKTKSWYEQVACTIAGKSFDVIDNIAQTTSPTCVVNSRTDTKVPMDSGDNIFAVLPANIPKDRIVTEASLPLDKNNGHNNFPVVETINQCIQDMHLDL